jgi:hypothetical protein
MDRFVFTNGYLAYDQPVILVIGQQIYTVNSLDFYMLSPCLLWVSGVRGAGHSSDWPADIQYTGNSLDFYILSPC